MRNLSHLAFKSENTLGRALPQELDRDTDSYFMPPFALDLLKILYSKVWRRLPRKTQVISGLNNVNIRDRMVHSSEVAAAAMQSGHYLGLNVPLLQTSALGHDLGHVPFGHLGERFIAEKLGESFRHEKFVIFVLEMVEREGMGLNLSYETLKTIRNHSRGSGLMVNSNSNILEDDVIMFCDKFSYIFSDYNDIQRIGYNGFTIPNEMIRLGANQTERLNNCLRALWKESVEKETISFEDSDEAKRFKVVRNFMYTDVYCKMDQLEDRLYMKAILERAYSFFQSHFGNSRQAALALALMSERDLYVIDSLLTSYGVKVVSDKIVDVKTFSIAELLPRIPKLAGFNFCNSDIFLAKENFGKISKAECFAL